MESEPKSGADPEIEEGWGHRVEIVGCVYHAQYSRVVWGHASLDIMGVPL